MKWLVFRSCPVNPDVIWPRNRCPSIRHKRFTLRTLVIAVAIIALMVAFRFELLELIVGWIYLSTVLTFVAAFLIARFCKPPCTTLWYLIFAPAFTLSAYTCFARYRITASIHDSFFPRKLPYPDHLIIQTEQYWRTPISEIPPSSIDIHGGMMETLAIVNSFAIISAAIAGMALGAAITRRSAR